MKIVNDIIEIKPEKYLDFIDLSDEVEKMVGKSGVKNGSVLIYSTHTTLAICVNEKEKGICKDFETLMNKIIPKDNYYHHNDLTERTENLVCQSAASDCLNGHSHCTHLLMRNSETVPIIEGKLILGTWQRIFAIELDCCRSRKVIVQISGLEK